MSRVRLRAIVRKEVLQLRRDPRSLILAFVLPVVLLVFFGYAITWDVQHIATAVVDQDQSAQSRALIDAFRSAGYFDLKARPLRTADIGPLLNRSRVQLALVIPPDFSAKLVAGRTAELQAIVDGSDANTATITLAYTQGVVQTWSSRVLLRGARLRLPLAAESRIWFNEELTSRNMIVPGLVAVIVAIIASMLTSLTISREWERGTMEQLAATPVSRAEVVIGKLIPYMAIGLIDICVSSAFGVFLFGVPFRGSPVLLLGLSFLFVAGALGLGMFISAVARSQVLAIQFTLLATFLPAFLLSGFMFTIEVMPAPLQAISFIVPARYFLVVTRGIFLKGVGLHVLWVQALFMLVFAAVGLGLAMRVFRKEIA
jgi:ABC-2 type transport system permease protein